jgi:hypothetical protein
LGHRINKLQNSNFLSSLQIWLINGGLRWVVVWGPHRIGHGINSLQNSNYLPLIMIWLKNEEVWCVAVYMGVEQHKIQNLQYSNCLSFSIS